MALPEATQGAGHACGERDLMRVHQPGQRRPQVVDVALQARQAEDLFGALQLHLRLLCPRCEIFGMALAESGQFAGCGKLFQREGADGFQQHKTRLGCGNLAQ